MTSASRSLLCHEDVEESRETGTDIREPPAFIRCRVLAGQRAGNSSLGRECTGYDARVAMAKSSTPSVLGPRYTCNQETYKS